MRGKKILLIIVSLVLLLTGLVLLVLRWRSNRSERTSLAGAPDGSFVVQVERPAFSGRPIWEVPRAIFGDGDRELRFSYMSPGATSGSVSPTLLELRANGGWDLVIKSDGQGRVVEGTRLLFTLILFDRSLKLNCRPADSGVDQYNTSARAGSDKLDGNFFLYLDQCKNAVSGKNTAGLPAFTVRGSLKGLPQSAPKNEGEQSK